MGPPAPNENYMPSDSKLVDGSTAKGILRDPMVMPFGQYLPPSPGYSDCPLAVKF